MTLSKPGADSGIYQMKVTLKWSRPPIWRRILVSGGTTLEALHWILQIVMGWGNEHLHQLHVGGIRYTDLTTVEMAPFETEDKDESKVKLSSVARRPKSKLLYEYDFGDGWMHELLVEKILPTEPHTHYPACVAGRGACPPEDCGGIGGYYDKLEAIRDPRHPEHEDIIDWMGADFDPDKFDLDSINKALKRIRK